MLLLEEIQKLYILASIRSLLIQSVMPKQTILRLQRIDLLIAQRATGSPNQFAKKIQISVSMLYLYLSALKDLGAPILYDRTRKTYYYGENGRIALAFIKK